MTYVGHISTTSNRADWEDTIVLIDAETGDLIDISLCRITMTVVRWKRNPNNMLDGYYGLPQVGYGYDSTGIMLTGSTDTGEITISSLGTFKWLFPYARMSGLGAGEYQIGIKISQNGRTMQLVVGAVIVREGIDMILSAGPAHVAPPPVIMSVLPVSGPTSGGTSIIIFGTGFTGTIAVAFGATNAGFTVNSDTQIIATSPAGVGTVDVTVTTAGGASATSGADQFTYYVVDPYYSNVVFLTGFEGPNGSTTAVDESSHAHGTAIVVHSAQISTAQKQAGNSSGLFASATQDWFKWPHSTDFELATSHFTIECFVYLNSIPAGAYSFFIDRWDIGIWSWALMVNTTGHLGWVVTPDGNTLQFDLTDTAAFTTANWIHVAVDYDGVKYRLYKNGVTVSTSSTARNIFVNATGELAIGSSNANAWPTDGYIDEVRITAGTARYATDTGFTVPTTPFPRH